MPPRGGWTPEQRALMRWLCLPGDDIMGDGRGLREHKSLTALAAHLGVTRQSLYDWQKLPGWDEALGVMAGRTFKSLKPEFIKTMSAVLLKPGAPGYDRVLTAMVRYVDPAMNDPEEQARWDAVLPELEATGDDQTELIAQEELRLLPLAERQIILNFMGKVRGRSNSNVLVEVKSYQVKKMLTDPEISEDDSPGNAVIELPALQNLNPQSIQCKPDTLPQFPTHLRQPIRGKRRK